MMEEVKRRQVHGWQSAGRADRENEHDPAVAFSPSDFALAGERNESIPQLHGESNESPGRSSPKRPCGGAADLC